MQSIQLKTLVICSMAVFLSGVAFGAVSVAEESRLDYSRWIGEDLYLQGQQVVSAELGGKGGGEHILLFEGRFLMSIGADRFSSDKAVVWLKENRTEFRGRTHIEYQAKVYLQDNVSAEKGEVADISGLSEKVLEEGRSMVVGFDVSGGIFVTAEQRETGDPGELVLYRSVLASDDFAGLKFGMAPLLTSSSTDVGGLPTERGGAAEVNEPKKKEPDFQYPINIRPAGEAALKMESTRTAEGEDVMTVLGRFYLWQVQDEEGGLLELQADNAVIWYVQGPRLGGREKAPESAVGEDIKAIYLSGDVVCTYGQRTIRAEEIFYDFKQNKALAVNAVMRNFDVNRGIPIYVRAAKLRQTAINQFAGEEITLTSSEFYLPQISLSASRVIITDTTSVDERTGELGDSSYDAQMHDVCFKVGGGTFFYWPFVRSNLQRPDVPIKSIRVGHDNVWGTSVETRWYLSRLLGLREEEGTDSTLAVDYYSERGFGTGAEIEYEREDYFGRLLGYVIDDHGEDRLGRQRRDLEPPRELRGRFLWQHRQFLPHNWQLTGEVSYLSDENFLEGFYRSEYHVGKEQETMVHLKRIEDNWGLAFLGKGRINDFRNKLEELPSAEFHWTGQSLFDDTLTFYSDSQVSRFRQRLASGSTLPVSEEFYTFMSERAELDMPMMWEGVKVVPFVAGTVAYEDGSGFYTDIDGGAGGREDNIWIGEAGARIFPLPFWKVYPDVESRLWDLNGLRHIIEPQLTVVGFAESDSIAEQRDILNVGISQRLQTKRGPADNQRTTDWMRLDMDVTWVDNSGDSSAGADQFIWNKPFIPLVNRFSPFVPQQDRRSSDIFGPRRNYIGADYIWRVSDTTAVLSDMNFDIQSGVVQQLNFGFSRMRWPNLSYYIGSRYLRRIDNGYGEEGSNAFTFAASYVLDPRYTVVFSQQYDFDYGANIRSDVTLMRRYHRIYCGITFRVDESLDRQAIIFTVWPEGLQEVGFGPKRYMGQGSPIRY